MDDAIRISLAKIIRDYGTNWVTDSPERLEPLLTDLCPEHPAEIAVLLIAAREGIPGAFTVQNVTDSIESTISELAKALQVNYAIAESAAEWAVVSWTLALGLPVESYPPIPLSSLREFSPQTSEAYTNRGRWYSSDGLHELALADFVRAIELDPQYSETYYQRGHTYNLLGQHQSALADLNRAIELSPGTVANYLCRGDVHSELKQYKLALADFDRAIEVYPDYITYERRGTLYAKLKQYEAAVADLERAIELDSDRFTIQMFGGRIYEKCGACRFVLHQYEAAIEDFNQFLEFQPSSVGARASRGICYAATKQYTAALTDLSFAIELQPDGVLFHTRSIAHLNLQHYEAALADLDRALESGPGNATYLRQRRFVASTSSPTADILSAEHVVTAQPQAQPPVALAEISGADLGRVVRVQGRVMTMKGHHGAVEATLDDGTAQILLVLWYYVFEDLAAPTTLDIGAEVAVTGTVWNRDKVLQVMPKAAKDVEILTPAEPSPLEKLSELSSADAGRVVRARGMLHEPQRFSAGAKVVLKDDTGDIPVLLWSELYHTLTPAPQANQQVEVVGVLNVYKDELELVPRSICDWRVRQMVN